LVDEGAWMMVASTIVPVADADAPGLPMYVHRLQHQTAQIVLLQQMAEAADGRLVRCRRNSEIHTNEPSQRRRLVQRLFHTVIRQIEPLLHKVGSQHDPSPTGRRPFR
jgi:hypothetical protein